MDSGSRVVVRKTLYSAMREKIGESHTCVLDCICKGTTAGVDPQLASEDTSIRGPQGMRLKTPNNRALQPTYDRADLARLQRALFESIDVRACKGLELGPFDKPLVPRHLGNVKYLDFVDEDTLRKRCAANPNRDAAQVVALDYVLGDLSIGERVQERFDYVVASHVIEHVPNMLGWLRELSTLLTPDTGRLFLIIPDRRFTFDAERPPTTLGELIENDELERSRPALRSVFDGRFYHKPIKSADVWRNPRSTDSIARTFKPEQALALMQQAKDTYIDCHCNVFSDQEFEALIRQSGAFRRHPFRIEKIRATERPFLDFMVLLGMRQCPVP